MGKATSPTKGKERIHYFGDMSKGVVASLSVLGDMIPVMARIAMASPHARSIVSGHDLHRRRRLGNGRLP